MITLRNIEKLSTGIEIITLNNRIFRFELDSNNLYMKYRRLLPSHILYLISCFRKPVRVFWVCKHHTKMKVWVSMCVTIILLHVCLPLQMFNFVMNTQCTINDASNLYQIRRIDRIESKSRHLETTWGESLIILII